MIERGWLTLFYITFATNFLSTLYFMVYVPESPKWLHTWSRYEETKEVLRKIAIFNGFQEEVIEDRIMRKKFIGEVKQRRNRDFNISMESQA
jgi:hypothetical protein